MPDFPNVSADGGVVIVIGMSSSPGQDHSGAAVVEITYDFTIVAKRDDGDLILDARDRLYGDGDPGNPSYGLHNHNLVVENAPNTRALTLLFAGESAIGTNDPDNLVAHTMQFRVLVESN